MTNIQREEKVFETLLMLLAVAICVCLAAGMVVATTFLVPASVGSTIAAIAAFLITAVKAVIVFTNDIWYNA